MIFSWLYPKKCVGCSKEGIYLCKNCRKKIYPVRQVYNSQPGIFDIWLSVFRYNQIIKGLIHKFKYRFIGQAGEILIKKALRFLSVEPIFRFSLNQIKKVKPILVPIPLHWYRFNWRGFNQAKIISRYLADDWHLRIDDQLIQRNKFTWPQSGLSRAKRIENVADAFKINRFRRIKNSPFLLVDDVLTTGETMRQAGRLLKKRQASWIGAFSLA